MGAIAGANTFDIRRDSTHNIHSDPGLREAALMMVFTVWEGLRVLEPTCSTFLRFVSTHTSGRTPDTSPGEGASICTKPPDQGMVTI